MKALHHAALKRAYRTLAQGMGGAALTAALAAVITDPTTTATAALAAFASTLVAAFASFWQGVALGLPEATDTTPGAGQNGRH